MAYQYLPASYDDHAQEPTVREPEKCAAWQWVDLRDGPGFNSMPLFPSLQHVLSRKQVLLAIERFPE